MMKAYKVELEIAGPTAMWTRPDTGDCPVSYPAPTYSAVAGIFKAICWGPAVEIIPFKVEICRPLHYEQYMTNYRGPLREKIDENSFQLMATVLTDVCYRLYAYVYPARHKDMLPDSAKAWDAKTTSPGHAYAAIFERRLKRGQSFTRPCLGWKEFTPTYVGPLRPETKVCSDISTVIPSMLRQVFDDGFMGKMRVVFDQNVEIKNGVLVYPNSGKGN